MKAWHVGELGEPQDVMRLVDVPEPVEQSGRLRIRVEATGLNFPDLLLCRGAYQERPELPFTPGIEIAGTVLDGPRAGERVVATPGLPRGGLAEVVSVTEEDVFPAPRGMAPAKAAAMLTTYQTGYAGLHRRAQLRGGETLLVHAGAGGVGSAAIQLGKAAGAFVIATAGGPDKTEVCAQMGADVVVDYLGTDFVEAVKEATDGRGADVIYDSVGGDIFDRSRKCIAFEGRLLVVGFAGGRIADAPTNHALIKNYSIVGLHYGLYRSKNPGFVQECHRALLDLWERREIDPLVSAELSMEEAPSGLAMLGDRMTVGKLVIRVAD